MKLLIALPVYDGKLMTEQVKCLLEEQALAMVAGDELQVRFLPSCSQIGMGRNQLVDDFINSDAEKIFFLDADVTWELGAILKLAHLPVDFVGGAYRYKVNEESYPVSFIPGELWANEHGLLEMEAVPGGFVAMSRKVFEVLKEKNPENHYTHQGRKTHCFYQMPFKNGQLWSEDALFCREWRDAGGKVFLDPTLTLTHWNFNIPFIGNIGAWLKARLHERIA